MTFDLVGCSKVVWRWKQAWKKKEEKARRREEGSASGEMKL
jgi:hypothetical protein